MNHSSLILRAALITLLGVTFIRGWDASLTTWVNEAIAASAYPSPSTSSPTPQPTATPTPTPTPAPEQCTPPPPAEECPADATPSPSTSPSASPSASSSPCPTPCPAGCEEDGAHIPTGNKFLQYLAGVDSVPGCQAATTTCPKCTCKTRPNTASFYLPTGNCTANGEVYDGKSMTAAVHICEYKQKKGKCYKATGAMEGEADMCYTGQSVVVRINDNGPGVAPGGLDMSPAAFNSMRVGCPEGTQTRMTITQVEVPCPQP